MEFIKNGMLSYEQVGLFLDKLPKDQWLEIDTALEENDSRYESGEIMPALIFFQNVGHIDLRNSNSQIKVLTERRNRNLKQLKDAIPHI